MNDGVKEASTAAGGSKIALVAVAIIIVAAIGGILIMNKFMEPDLNPNEISATLIIDYGNGTVEWYNVTTVNNSVPGLLDEAIGTENYELMRNENGVDFILRINGVGYTYDGTLVAPTRSWKYYLGGNLAPEWQNAFESRNNFTLIHDGQIVKLAVEDGWEPSGIFHDTGISVTTKIDYGNGTVEEDIIITQNFTALGALEEMVGYGNLDITDYDWGVLIDGINNVTTGSSVQGIDDTSNYYWMWYVNDDYAYVGASQYILQDGDVMEWKFEESAW